jgi:hypothetical protein
LTGAGEAGPPGQSHGEAPRPSTEQLARAVFVLLVAACFAAFFVTQRLKHTPTVVQRFERTPTFSPSSPVADKRQERLSFKLDHADEATVSIIDTRGNVVATLVRDYPIPRYKQFSLRWNGRTGTARRYQQLTSESGHRILVAINEGRPAPAGEYRVRFYLRRSAREVLSPWSFTLVGR